MRRLLGLGLGRWAGVACMVPALAMACSASSDGSEVKGNGGSGNGGSAGDTNFGGTAGTSLDGGGGLPNHCAADRYDGEPVPLDIFLLLDRSGSMRDSGKWSAVTNSVNSFLSSVPGSGVSVGISFFPVPWSTNPNLPAPCDPAVGCGAYGPCLPIIQACHLGAGDDSCVSVDYTQPRVPLTELPAAAGLIQSAMAAESPDGNTTPVQPALQGAHDYARVVAEQRPDHQVVVVLATDGEPTGCSANSISGAASVAAAANSATPSVKTFVIGIGDLSALNTIAASGGTGSAFIVSSGNAGQGFLDAMNEIRGALTCQFKIPNPTTGEPNKDLVNVGLTEPGKDQAIIPRVNGPGACAGQPGWYYDNPSDPSQILLCPSSCDLVEFGGGVVVDVMIGCDSVVR
ncbi:MAG: VWA domain-containing protein [Polyangiaceae bacterium]|nr:VWA domain-containing protein [Polyangiaceae bacterium]MCW5789040.1 VWA domain-containing protein [Polyangiaceae bacterium]